LLVATRRIDIHQMREQRLRHASSFFNTKIFRNARQSGHVGLTA
jgi:hypothetical protein